MANLYPHDSDQIESLLATLVTVHNQILFPLVYYYFYYSLFFKLLYTV